MLDCNTLREYVGRIRDILYHRDSSSIDEVVHHSDGLPIGRRGFLGYAARGAVALGLGGLLLFGDVGCGDGNSRTSTTTSAPATTSSLVAQATEPNKDLVEKIYQAKLSRYSESDSYILRFYENGKESFHLERKISGNTLNFKEKLIGIWGSALGTEDFPSSCIRATYMELLPDYKIKYWEEKGHEVFDKQARTSKVDEVPQLNM